MAGGAITLVALATSLISEGTKQSALQTSAYMFGYTFWSMIYVTLAIGWIWANGYAMSKLNKLRDEATQLRTMPKQELINNERGI